MPILFWLALLLGYLTGVAAAVLLLPSRLIEPLYGPLALTTVLALESDDVIGRLFGPDYAAAVPSLRVLSMMFLLTYMATKGL